MTREEIENIPKNVNTLLDLSVTMRTRQKLDEKLKKVCELAIKALEQEPFEDCISRAELLKAIDTWDKFGLDDTNHLFRLDNLSLPYYVPYIYYDDAIKCIKGMPSVQQEKDTKTDALVKIKAELLANAEMHEDGDYYLRDKWVSEIIDKYRQEDRNGN